MGRARNPARGCRRDSRNSSETGCGPIYAAARDLAWGISFAAEYLPFEPTCSTFPVLLE